MRWHWGRNKSRMTGSVDVIQATSMQTSFITPPGKTGRYETERSDITLTGLDRQAVSHWSGSWWEVWRCSPSSWRPSPARASSTGSPTCWPAQWGEELQGRWTAMRTLPTEWSTRMTWVSCYESDISHTDCQGYEERFYPSNMWVCTRSGGFMNLFRYISGDNTRSKDPPS